MSRAVFSEAVAEQEFLRLWKALDGRYQPVDELEMRLDGGSGTTRVISHETNATLKGQAAGDGSTFFPNNLPLSGGPRAKKNLRLRRTELQTVALAGAVPMT